MHILFIGNSIDPISGYGTMTHMHCTAFFRKGIPFTLLLPRAARRISVPYANCIRYVLPALPLGFNSFSSFIRIPFLYTRIPLVGVIPTAVHSLVDFPYAVIGHRIARSRNIPFFFSALGTYSVAPFKKRVDRHLFMPVYTGADRIFAISLFTANAMQKAAGRERPIDIVYIPVNEPVRPIGHIRHPVPLPHNARILLTVSSFKERKGIEVLIKAMPFILQSVPQAHLVIVAGGNATPCRVLAEKQGVLGSISFIRNSSADELFFLFEQSAVFVLTPLYADHQFEGYGLVYIEAGWHKKPVVASFSGGVPEAVIHGETGLVVTENDEQETARAIRKVLLDGALARRLGAGGYALAKSRTVSAYVDTLIRLYELSEKK